MVRFGDKSTVISTVLLLLIVNAEVINVHATISRRRLLGSIKGSALKKNNRGRRSKMSTSFVEMSESQQLASLQREWMIMREGVDHLLGGSEVDIMNSDAEDVGGIPPPVGANKYGSPRNRAAESKDTYKAKKVCQCMVNELLFGLTKGVLPYRPNACAGRYCYAFDAGEGVTPLYYKRLNHKWYWRPSKPPTESHRELDEWMRTSTTKVGVSGLSSLALRALQTVGLTDVVDENKFLMKILEDYNPYKLKGHGVPAGSRANSMDAKYDLYMCMDRKHVDSPEEVCHVKKSGCMRNLVARYFQYVEVQTRAIQKRKNKVERLKDYLGIGLDILGMTEPFGFVFDLLSAGFSYSRGHHLEAALSCLAAVPGLGQWFTGLKWVVKGSKLTKQYKMLATGAKSMKLFLAKLALKAQRGVRRSYEWFKLAGQWFKAMGVTIKGIIKLKSAWVKVIKEGVQRLATQGKRAVKWVLDQFKKVQQLWLDGPLKFLCQVRTALNVKIRRSTVLEVIGMFMEATALPYVKELGEWIQAFAPCIVFACKEGGRSDPQEYYQCGLHLGFESFKKAAAKTDEAWLESIGEYDPRLFSEKLPDIDMSGSAKKVKATLETESCKAKLVQSDADSSLDDIFKNIKPFKPIVPAYKPNKARGTDGQKEDKGSVANGEKTPCDRRTWYKLDASTVGTCEDTSDDSSCQDGVFISRYCRGRPNHIKCCVRNECSKGLKGKCVEHKNCNLETHNWVSNHCKGPSGVRCCTPKSSA